MDLRLDRALGWQLGSSAVVLLGGTPLSVTARVRRQARLKHQAAQPVGHVFRDAAAEPVPSARGAWDLFYPAFADAVRGTQPVPVDPWDAVATAAVLEAARASARTGHVVSPMQTA